MVAGIWTCVAVAVLTLGLQICGMGADCLGSAGRHHGARLDSTDGPAVQGVRVAAFAPLRWVAISNDWECRPAVDGAECRRRFPIINLGVFAVPKKPQRVLVARGDM